jgi:hypothetical protein
MKLWFRFAMMVLAPLGALAWLTCSMIYAFQKNWAASLVFAVLYLSTQIEREP